ncbi:MAG: glutaredoxin family protein [Pseudomonadota bacterium]
MSRLMIYSREGCGLCEELLLELVPWAAERGESVEVRDVDDDPILKRRYGLKIPVLLVDGEPIALGHLDWNELERAWNAGR